MLKQIVSQLEQMSLKLGLKNGYTRTISNFKRHLMFHKSGPERALGCDH